MYVPDKKTFLEKAREGNLIPVWRELLADQDTPVSAYERLRTALREGDAKPYTFLLESVEQGIQVGRYSFVGVSPRGRRHFRVAGRNRLVECGTCKPSLDGSFRCS